MSQSLSKSKTSRFRRNSKCAALMTSGVHTGETGDFRINSLELKNMFIELGRKKQWRT